MPDIDAQPDIDAHADVVAGAMEAVPQPAAPVVVDGSAAAPLDGDGGAPEALVPPLLEEAQPAAADPLADAGLAFVRRPAAYEVHFELPDGQGAIRYNVTSCFFRAHCPLHRDCARRRSALESFTSVESGQGRPIGLLVHWLENAARYADKSAHMKAKVPPHGERAEARRRFDAWPGADNIAGYERFSRPGEPEEPVRIT